MAHSTTLPYLSTGMPAVDRVVATLLQTVWIALHLFLPTFYRFAYEAKCFPPLEGFGYYHSCLKIEDGWNKRVIGLQAHWRFFKKISIVLLSFIAPYLSTTKAPIQSFTFISGSLCIFHSFIGVIISHVYISDAGDLRSPTVIDYWLEASSCPGGMYFWTLLSLLAAWFSTAIGFFLGFIIASLWEDIAAGMHSFSDTSVLWHRALLLFSVALADVHLFLVFVAWSRIKARH